MCLYPITLNVKRKGSEVREPVTVSCGKCLECLSKYSTEWAFRIYLESQQYDECIFLTLTYNSENLPENGTLCRRDVQLFIKRLRSAISPKKIRFFYCGEYGSKRKRPHYHIIIFNFSPSDKKFFKRVDGIDYYNSDFISDLWSYYKDVVEDGKKVRKKFSKGFILFSDVTLDSAKYSAKYMQKLQKVPKGCDRPFIGMSNRPGIGYYSIDLKYLDSDSIYINGKRIQVPRYFLKVLERAGFDFTDFHNARIARGELFGNNLEERRKKAQEFLKSSKILLTKS